MTKSMNTEKMAALFRVNLQTVSGKRMAEYIGYAQENSLRFTSCPRGPTGSTPRFQK